MRAQAPKIMLGLAFGPEGFEVAEVRRARGGDVTSKRATLAMKPGADLDNPAGLGAALAGLLKEHGFKANHAAIGLCSRWVLASPRTLPPLDDAALLGAVRLQIERDYAGGRDDLVFDYTEPTPPNGQRKLVLMGAPRKRLQQATQAALAANLRVLHAMPTALASVKHATAETSVADTADLLCITLEADGAALVHLKAGRCHALTSVAFDPASLDSDPASGPAASMPWAQSITRAAEALGITDAAVTILNTAGLDADKLERARQILGQSLGDAHTVTIDPAAAVASAALRRTVAVNFARPRLMQQPKRTLGTTARWGLRVAVLVLLIIAAVGYLWWEKAAELQSLQDEYATLQPQAEKLAEIQRDTRAAAGWYDDRTPVLECLLELTRTFPRQGRIWVTALTLDENAAGTLNCKAADERTMYAYLNAMKASPHLADVQLQVRQTTDREGQTVRFDVTFRYAPSSRDIAKTLSTQRADTAAATSGGEG